MASFNKVILAGHITRDPELRYTPKGTAVANIGLAVNRNWTTESGEKREEVTFIDVEAWGRQGEVLAQYTKKGQPLLVEGRLKLESWEDKNTKKKMQKLKVILESFSFLATKQSDGESKPSRPSEPASSPETPLAGDGPADSDDVPF